MVTPTPTPAETGSRFRIQALPGTVVVVHETADSVIVSELEIHEAVVMEGALQAAIAKARQSAGMD